MVDDATWSSIVDAPTTISEEAVTSIQAAARGGRVRRRLGAAIRVQSIVRGGLVRITAKHAADVRLMQAQKGFAVTAPEAISTQRIGVDDLEGNIGTATSSLEAVPSPGAEDESERTPAAANTMSCEALARLVMETAASIDAQVYNALVRRLNGVRGEDAHQELIRESPAALRAQNEREDAVSVVQREWRGSSVATRLRQAKEEKAKAATAVQKTWRGSSVAKRVRQANELKAAAATATATAHDAVVAPAEEALEAPAKEAEPEEAAATAEPEAAPANSSVEVRLDQAKHLQALEAAKVAGAADAAGAFAAAGSRVSTERISAPAPGEVDAAADEAATAAAASLEQKQSGVAAFATAKKADLQQGAVPEGVAANGALREAAELARLRGHAAARTIQRGWRNFVFWRGFHAEVRARRIAAETAQRLARVAAEEAALRAERAAARFAQAAGVVRRAWMTRRNAERCTVEWVRMVISKRDGAVVAATACAAAAATAAEATCHLLARALKKFAPDSVAMRLAVARELRARSASPVRATPPRREGEMEGADWHRIVGGGPSARSEQSSAARHVVRFEATVAIDAYDAALMLLYTHFTAADLAQRPELEAHMTFAELEWCCRECGVLPLVAKRRTLYGVFSSIAGGRPLSAEGFGSCLASIANVGLSQAQYAALHTTPQRRVDALFEGIMLSDTPRLVAFLDALGAVSQAEVAKRLHASLLGGSEEAGADDAAAAAAAAKKEKRQQRARRSNKRGGASSSQRRVKREETAPDASLASMNLPRTRVKAVPQAPTAESLLDELQLGYGCSEQREYALLRNGEFAAFFDADVSSALYDIVRGVSAVDASLPIARSGSGVGAGVGVAGAASRDATTPLPSLLPRPKATAFAPLPSERRSAASVHVSFPRDAEPSPSPARRRLRSPPPPQQRHTSFDEAALAGTEAAPKRRRRRLRTPPPQQREQSFLPEVDDGAGGSDAVDAPSAQRPASPRSRQPKRSRRLRSPPGAVPAPLGEPPFEAQLAYPSPVASQRKRKKRKQAKFADEPLVLPNVSGAAAPPKEVQWPGSFRSERPVPRDEQQIERQRRRLLGRE